MVLVATVKLDQRTLTRMEHLCIIRQLQVRLGFVKAFMVVVLVLGTVPMVLAINHVPPEMELPQTVQVDQEEHPTVALVLLEMQDMLL
jgi:hypothetical protein